MSLLLLLINLILLLKFVFQLEKLSVKDQIIVTASSNQSSGYFNNITMILLNVRTVKERDSNIY
jgi:hypothetical protein